PRTQCLAPGRADAEAHALEVARAELLGDRAQAVVSGHAAAGLDAHLAGREIELVVTDHDVPERQLVKARGFGDGVAGVIHEGLRLLQEDLDAAEKAFAHQARKLAAPGTEAVRTGDRLDRHEAD